MGERSRRTLGWGVGMKIGVENGEGHMWDSVATLQTGLGIDMDGCPLGCLDYPAGSISPVVSAAVCYPGGRGDAEQVGLPVYLAGGTLVGSQGSPARPGAKTQ